MEVELVLVEEVEVVLVEEVLVEEVEVVLVEEVLVEEVEVVLVEEVVVEVEPRLIHNSAAKKCFKIFFLTRRCRTCG